GLRATAALPIHWGTFRLSFEGWDTPPRMLDLMMACAGGPPGRFTRRGFGVPWEVPAVGATAALDLGKLDACEKSGAVRALP
ncbi:MAG: Zn-dependent hydrolase, partial [Sphingomonas bacterium]|nr:Zn-dependent hydrolase [Sphingomonas bacterium]